MTQQVVIDEIRRLREALAALEQELTEYRQRYKFCAYCACGYEWQDGWGDICGGCRRADDASRRAAEREEELAEAVEREKVNARAFLAQIDLRKAAEAELADEQAALTQLRDAWNVHMATCPSDVPAVTWAQIETWKNAPSDTASPRPWLTALDNSDAQIATAKANLHRAVYIEKLEQELAEAKAERDDAFTTISLKAPEDLLQMLRSRIARMEVRAEAVEAERDKLREALREIAAMPCARGCHSRNDGVFCQGCIARAALAATEDTPTPTAWLIERGQQENHTPTIWWIAGPSLASREGEAWTQDASAATRFSTREEAARVVDSLFRRLSDSSARATEHVWVVA